MPDEETRFVSKWLLIVPVVAFALGMALSGALLVAFPEIRASSPTLIFLPRWTTAAWGVSLLLGGLMTTVGVARRRADFEASGLVILGSAQIFGALTSLLALGLVASALGVLLRGSLAVALIGRAFFLSRGVA